MPKPGAWMVHVKHAFGVLILGTSVYYGYLGYTLFADRWVDAVRRERRAWNKSCRRAGMRPLPKGLR